MAHWYLVVFSVNSLCLWLTGVVFNQLLQAWEGVEGGDVVSTFVQAADFVVFDHISLLGHIIPDRQREGPWGGEEDGWAQSSGGIIDRARGPTPGEVSLPRTRKEPTLFPGARSSRSVSFLLMSLKNHLRQRKEAEIVTRARTVTEPSRGEHFLTSPHPGYLPWPHSYRGWSPPGLSPGI